MAAITHIGNRLLIIRGKYRGWTGEITEILYGPCGIIDYEMLLGDSDDDPGFKITIPAEDCREYNPGSINLEAPFDITNYLSVNQMRDIAKTIYEKKVVEYLDDIFNNRKSIGCGSIPNQVLHEVIKQYAGNMVEQYKDAMLNTFKKVIESDLPASGDEDEKSFGRSIQWALENAATTYIKEHPDEIYNIMKDKLHDQSKKLIEEKLSYSISKAIEKAANEVLSKVLNDN